MIECAECGTLFEMKIPESRKIIECPECRIKLVTGIDLSRECHDNCNACSEIQRRTCAEIDEAIKKGDTFEHLIITVPWDGKMIRKSVRASKKSDEPPSCCGQPMVEDWRLDNQFWIHVPVYRCQHCGHDTIRMVGYS